MKNDIIEKTVLWMVILLVLPAYILAAGGGGGGSSSSGLGFGSRDSVYILVNQDYSEKFSLKNSTKYELKISVVNGTVDVNFGSVSIKLAEGGNFVDLNNNNLADINFNLISTKGKVANIRIIDAKDTVGIAKAKEDVIEEKPAKKDKEAVTEDGELKCGNLSALKERVSCRLDLEKEEQEEELELYYLPEECRSLSGSQRGLCIARYKSVQTCWKFPVGNERISCVKRAIKLENLQQQKEICNVKTGNEKTQCKKELKDKGYSLIKWHFYDLEERAEEFMVRGLVDKAVVADFIEKTEQNKAKFNEARTKEERKEVILSVKEDWKGFTNTIKENLGG